MTDRIPGFAFKYLDGRGENSCLKKGGAGRGRRRKKETGVLGLVQEINSLEQRTQVSRCCSAPASRKNYNNWRVRRQPVFLQKIGLRQRRLYQPRKRMADISSRYVVATKEGFLEGKDTQQVVNQAAHRLKAALPPGPNLRGHQVDDGDSGRL